MRFSLYWRYLYEITHQLIIKDLKAKYKRHVLGYLWCIVATQLLLAFIMDFALRRVIRIPVENYALFLLTTLSITSNEEANDQKPIQKALAGKST